jgi:hypothetical protein
MLNKTEFSELLLFYLPKALRNQRRFYTVKFYQPIRILGRTNCAVLCKITDNTKTMKRRNSGDPRNYEPFKV